LPKHSRLGAIINFQKCSSPLQKSDRPRRPRGPRLQKTEKRINIPTKLQRSPVGPTRSPASAPDLAWRDAYTFREGEEKAGFSARTWHSAGSLIYGRYFKRKVSTRPGKKSALTLARCLKHVGVTYTTFRYFLKDEEARPFVVVCLYVCILICSFGL